MDERGFPNSYLSPKPYSAFRGKFTLLIGSDLLVAPLVFRPQYNHIICRMSYPDATEHLPMMVLLNFSSTRCGGACGGREVRTERHRNLSGVQHLKMLGFSLLAVVAAAHLAAQNMLPDAEKQLARDIYKQFVEIKSGYTTGATTPVAEAAAARLKAAGFPESDIFIGGASPTKANLVVRYHGAGTRKPILLLAHTDVVEAKRGDWSRDPFQF